MPDEEELSSSIQTCIFKVLVDVVFQYPQVDGVKFAVRGSCEPPAHCEIYARARWDKLMERGDVRRQRVIQQIDRRNAKVRAYREETR